MNSIPKKIASAETPTPKQPTVMPRIITKPSLDNIPNEAIRIPSPGMQLERGIGNKIKLEKNNIKNPVMRSARGLVMNKQRGFKNLSIFLITVEDF